MNEFTGFTLQDQFTEALKKIDDLVKSADKEEKDNDGHTVPSESKGITLDGLAEMIRRVKSLKEFAYDLNPNMIRAIKFGCKIDAATETYVKLLDSTKRSKQQMKITMYFTQQQPQPPTRVMSHTLPLQK